MLSYSVYSQHGEQTALADCSKTGRACAEVCTDDIVGWVVIAGRRLTLPLFDLRNEKRDAAVEVRPRCRVLCSRSRAVGEQGHLPQLTYRADTTSCSHGNADHDHESDAQGSINWNVC